LEVGHNALSYQRIETFRVLLDFSDPLYDFLLEDIQSLIELVLRGLLLLKNSHDLALFFYRDFLFGEFLICKHWLGLCSSFNAVMLGQVRALRPVTGGPTSLLVGADLAHRVLTKLLVALQLVVVLLAEDFPLF
jgi:hypothetical protein